MDAPAAVAAAAADLLALAKGDHADQADETAAGRRRYVQKRFQNNATVGR